MPRLVPITLMMGKHEVTDKGAQGVFVYRTPWGSELQAWGVVRAPVGCESSGGNTNFVKSIYTFAVGK